MEKPLYLLIHNINADTTEFLVVVGRYNFSVCKGFNMPVVGLPRGWFAEYRHFHPFTIATRCEFVITRVAPALLGTVDLDPAATRAAIASANYEMNVHVVTSLVRDQWVRDHFKIANSGVFQVAQQRFRARDLTALEEYKKNFRDLPLAGDTQAIVDFCRPPQSDATPRLLPEMPRAVNEHEWKTKSPAEQAAILHSWSTIWERPAPAAGPVRSRDDQIVIEIPADPVASDNDWKGRPNPEQLESLRNDNWKRF